VGVYGATLDSFLDALRRADVKLVYDVRQRRGVRGREYAWANARRLQDALDGAGIGYEHRVDLAPTTELRQLQYREDARLGERKRSRAMLADAYVDGYTAEILDKVDVGAFVEALPQDGAAALLCVEREPEACHRSLIAARLAEHGVDVVDLRP